MIEKASNKELDMILLGDLNYDYVVNESLHTNPIHYIEALYEMSQLITEKTRVTQSTESTLDIILTTNPGLHKRSGVIKKTLSDHYLTFTELSLPKKTSQDLHNTVTFRNYGHFDESEFVNDIQSNDLLNGRHREIKWEDWKNAFLSLSNKHAPIKTARLKVRSNPWMTSDIVKLMYKRDKIHELAVKRKDNSLMNEYRKLRNNNLLLQVYKSYVQPRLDYGITLYGCSTQKNIDLIQRVQNHAARLITGNFDYINCRGIELVKSLNLYTIRDRRDYFLTILMFKSIHGIAPTYLSDRVVMNFDVNGYDTRTSDMELYLPTLREEAYRNSFMYMGGKLWNDLPEFVQNSANIESFKRNYKMSKLLMNSWLIQQFLRLFLRFVRFCVMKWLFLTFWAVRSIPWCGWIFVSHIAYTILNYVSVSSNLVLRF